MPFVMELTICSNYNFTLYYFQAFSVVSYNNFAGFWVFTMHFISTFSWNFTDLFLTLMSLSISSKIRLFNKAILKNQWKVGQFMDFFVLKQSELFSWFIAKGRDYLRKTHKLGTNSFISKRHRKKCEKRVLRLELCFCHAMQTIFCQL